jgi:hypothetical protein
LPILRLTQSSDTALRARANWYEHGEKSNKYFLSLNKKYKSKNLEGISYRGQNKVSKEITGLYKKLYEFKEVDLEEGDFYDICRKLSQDARNQMEAELSKGDLLMALNTCADSAPGLDGIPHSAYKKLWSIAGSFLLNSWKDSCNTGYCLDLIMIQ